MLYRLAFNRKSKTGLIWEEPLADGMVGREGGQGGGADREESRRQLFAHKTYSMLSLQEMSGSMGSEVSDTCIWKEERGGEEKHKCVRCN